ncbi:uncharacterized protein LOC119082819 [Bradysia coprophila]|uniref:uncharacterized protein LOC119082819 n=1 Tax=Bradysia coprophila TaxID=38358 RepID=UPI00187D91C2|nr:uncharacterized protein LOC119082819 [Bradysia coprophila]
MKVHFFSTILFAAIGCMHCDVSHLFTSTTTEPPTTKDSLDSISIITKQELNDNSDLLKNNVVGYRPYSFSKMMMQLIDFMEINQLSEPVNRNSLVGNERVKYYYDKPQIPFDAEETSREEIDYRTQSPKDDRPIKLETFTGYEYPKPPNPMTYPEKSTTSTTESYEDFPGASARILLKVDE